MSSWADDSDLGAHFSVRQPQLDLQAKLSPLRPFQAKRPDSLAFTLLNFLRMCAKLEPLQKRGEEPDASPPTICLLH